MKAQLQLCQELARRLLAYCDAGDDPEELPEMVIEFAKQVLKLEDPNNKDPE